MNTKYTYVITTDTQKMLEFVNKGWELVSSLVVEWLEPQDGVMKAGKIEYTLRSEDGIMPRIETK